MELGSSSSTGCFSVSTETANWNVYLDKGGIYYGINSTQTRSLLKFKLGTLGSSGTAATSALAEIPDTVDSIEFLIVELLQKGVIDPQYVPKLALDFMKESIETLLWVEDSTFEWKPGERLSAFTFHPQFKLSKVDLSKAIEYYQKRLVQWQKIQHSIKSPYERPYLFDYHGVLEKLSPKLHERFTKLFTGLTLRQIAPLLQQDDLKIAQFILPFIEQGAIVLCEPPEPFIQLPYIPLPDITSGAPTLQEVAAHPLKNHKIACIDDSPSVLDEMQRLLGNKGFEVTKIDDPIKASALLFRIRPDLILMDVTMPEINGYKLCNLLRDSVMFRNTPIVMVSGHRGIINKAKAKIAGATDYLTKPFTRDALLDVVERYLNTA